MANWIRWGAAVLGVVLPVALQAQQPPQRQPDPLRVHDPAIIKQGDTYYVFSTGNGISMRRSTDLVNWEPLPPVFADLPGMLPPWAADEVPGARSIWAPDIAYFNRAYHLYYSLSTFGSNRSVIGLATNETLDPTAPNYRWVDRGKVVESFSGVSTHNAIDPNVVFDERRQPWLNWGSFWGGVKMRKLDPNTGLTSREDTTLYSLAARTSIEATQGNNRPRSVEAPFIIRRGDYYYLFLSFDRCCAGVRSTYNIRVGRSEEVTGPYVDAIGVPMTRGGGTVVLAGYGRVRGPGHNSILTEGETHYLVHHYYDAEDGGRPRMHIRPLTWTEDGWPIAGEQLTIDN
jgi:arabinan endo-1,5-alpha-L-arabinosidase